MNEFRWLKQNCESAVTVVPSLQDVGFVTMLEGNGSGSGGLLTSWVMGKGDVECA